MAIVYLIVVMVIVGLVMGWIGGLIWHGKRPLGVAGDYLLAVLTAVVVGLIDWFVIPAMGFSQTMQLLGVAIEPAAGALLVLWIVRLAGR